MYFMEHYKFGYHSRALHQLGRASLVLQRNHMGDSTAYKHNYYILNLGSLAYRCEDQTLLCDE